MPNNALLILKGIGHDSYDDCSLHHFVDSESVDVLVLRNPAGGPVGYQMASLKRASGNGRTALAISEHGTRLLVFMVPAEFLKAEGLREAFEEAKVRNRRLGDAQFARWYFCRTQTGKVSKTLSGLEGKPVPLVNVEKKLSKKMNWEEFMLRKETRRKAVSLFDALWRGR